MVPLPKIFAVEVVPLNPPIRPIGHIQNVVAVDRDAVDQVELAGTSTRRSPLMHSLAAVIVDQHARIAVSVGDENLVFRETDIGRSAEASASAAARWSLADFDA